MTDLLEIALGTVAGLAAGLATRKWKGQVKCAHFPATYETGGYYDKKIFRSQRCRSISDPRCMGGNCTKHCVELCNGKCLE
jgi:hypothetical protein